MRRLFSKVSKDVTKQQNEIASRILKESTTALNFSSMSRPRNYLTLSRASAHLVGRESGSASGWPARSARGLTGRASMCGRTEVSACTSATIARLLENAEAGCRDLRQFRDRGRKHDEDAILTADHVIDMGPGGRHSRRRDHRPKGTPAKCWPTRKKHDGGLSQPHGEIPIPSAARFEKSNARSL